MWEKLKDLAYQIKNQPKFDEDPFVSPMRFGCSQTIVFAVMAIVTFCRGWSLAALTFYSQPNYYCPSASKKFLDMHDCYKECEKELTVVVFSDDVEYVCFQTFKMRIKMSIGVSSVGGCILGILTDVYGRKKILNLSSIGFFCASMLISTSSDFDVFIISSAVRMMFINGSMISGFVLISEVVGRSRLGILITFIFAFMDLGAIALLAGSFFVQQWRIVEVAITSISCLLLISIFIVPETPRWYFAKDNVPKSAAVLKKLIRRNRMVPKGIDERLSLIYRDLRSRPRSNDDFLDIFKYTRLRSIFLIFFFLQFIISLIFDVGVITLPNFSSHPRTNALITNVIIVSCRIVFSLVLRRLANKDVLIIALIFNCCGELVIAILQTSTGTLSIWVSAIVQGITWATVNPVMVTYYIELFPTNIRGTTYGAFIISDIVGLILSTVVTSLAIKCAWLPGGLNFIFSFIACFVSTNLPQIPNYALPQCNRDAEFAARGLDPIYPLYALEKVDS